MADGCCLDGVAAAAVAAVVVRKSQFTIFSFSLDFCVWQMERPCDRHNIRIMGAIVMTFNDLTVNYFCTFFSVNYYFEHCTLARTVCPFDLVAARENISQLNWNWTVIIVFSSTLRTVTSAPGRQLTIKTTTMVATKESKLISRKSRGIL